MKNIILCSILVLTVSCSSLEKEKLHAATEACIKEKSKTFTLETFNIYDYCHKIEQILVKQKFFIKKSKQEYVNFIIDIAENENKELYLNLFNKINKELTYSGYLMNPGVLSSVFVCIKKNYNSNEVKKIKEYSSYLNSINAITESPLLNNFSLNKNLINSTPNNEFESIVFKAPLIAIIYSNLYYFNETGGDNSKWLVGYKK
jgi:hypothetical protein